jgi:invasion protein IalB
MRILGIIACVLIVVGIAVVPCHAAKRVALVIGNADYAYADKLTNPVTDSRRMRDALTKLGFDVVYGENLGKQALERTIGRFATAAQDSDVALVYYAGHGATFGDVPYVVPIDAQFSSFAEMPYELEPVETLIGELRRAKGLRIAILDACRDNAAERNLKRVVASRGSEVTRGLARVKNPEGLILAYATQYMSTAADGPANANSPFTAALLRNLGTPGLDVKDLFFRVGREVINATHGAQRPEISVSFYDPYTLVPEGAASTALPAPAQAPTAPAQSAAKPAEGFTYSAWTKFCDRGADAGGAQVCYTGRVMRGANGTPVAAAALVEPDRSGKKSVRVTVPLQMQVQYGARLGIDQSDPLQSTFSVCSASGGCVADFEATSALIDRLRGGQTLIIQSVNLTGQVVNYPIPLADFRIANDAPPSDPNASEAQKPLAQTLAAGAQTIVDISRLTYSPWTKFCGDGADGGQVCFTGRDGRNASGSPVVAAALVESGGEAKKILRVTLPTGVKVQYGTRVAVDDEQPVQSPFLTCFTVGCLANYEAARDLIAKLRTGRVLKVQAVGPDGNVVTASIPLPGFREANDGPPSDPRALEAQRK